MQNQAYFVGIDLHKELIQVCVLDGRGEKVSEHRFQGGSLEQGQAVVKVLGQWNAGGRYAVEAIGMNRWLVNAMRAQGMDVVVVDPTKLNLRMLGKKTDRRDAYEIARRLWLGDIDRNARTYYPDEEQYGCRKVLRTRHKLVQVRQQLVNQVRGLLNAYRIEAPKGELSSKKNLEWLARVELSSQILTECLRRLGEALRSVQSSIDALTLRIEEEASREEISSLHENLEGVGPQTALTLVHELGDVKRFTSTRAVASYAGLAPRVANSADKAHHGKITKRGNSEVRWILSEVGRTPADTERARTTLGRAAPAPDAQEQGAHRARAASSDRRVLHAAPRRGLLPRALPGHPGRLADTARNSRIQR